MPSKVCKIGQCEFGFKLGDTAIVFVFKRNEVRERSEDRSLLAI
jgi:hypothetical protein